MTPSVCRNMSELGKITIVQSISKSAHIMVHWIIKMEVKWLKLSSEDVQDQIFKFAKKGLTPSQIGVLLRDSHGVAQVRHVTGNKILRILKAKGLAPDLPEDLYSLIKKAVNIRKHLERNRKDKDAKFRLILVESRIHRLAPSLPPLLLFLTLHRLWWARQQQEQHTSTCQKGLSTTGSD
ncbi:hypothetical protein C0Q70_04535 [Pomacea canaliculata]|uniref:Small ribosomal subunit protein uS15 n=1 Tax=Pomacea canaliculata TaxID=400727 RepID=A0A2T7PIN5_POMCA|nr:hypothetical protein C0Q70_04535 [Pomacea canaliculata]